MIQFIKQEIRKKIKHMIFKSLKQQHLLEGKFIAVF